MKTRKLIPSSAFLTLLALSGVNLPVQATTIDWSATAGTTAWATGSNWVGGTAPANDLTTDIAQFNQSAYAVQPTATSLRNVGGLIFGNDSTATAAVTITTSTNTNRLNVGASGIVMNTQSGTVAIGGASSTAGLQLGGSQSWTNNSSSLLTVNSVSGQTAGQNYTLTFDGSGSGGTTITGAIYNDYSQVNTGALSLVINTTGGVTTLAGSNGFTGDTTLTAGVLALNNINALLKSALNTAGTGTVTTNATALVFGGLKGARDIASVITSGYGSVTALSLNPQSGTSTYSGVISNGSGNTTFTKIGAGTQVLEGANTFSGVLSINAGVLGVSSLGNASGPSTLGASANTASNLALNGGTLQLTGATTSAQSTDRLFTVGVNGGTLDSSGGVGSSMNFTNVGTITGVNSVGNRTLTLTGARNGSLASIIGQRNAVDSITSILKSGNGTWTLGGANTYTGSTTVSAGTLLINGSVGTGGVTVAAGGTLGGNGSVSGLVTVNSGGTLSPGNSPGVATYSGGLTLETGSSFAFELAANSTSNRGTDFDGVNVTGGVFNLQTGVVFNLTLNGVGSTTDYTAAFWDSSQSWLVFDNANAPTIAALFTLGSVSNDSLGNNFSVTGGNFGFSQVGSDVYLNYSAIPEPSTWFLLAGSLTCLVVLRRRRS